MKFVADFHIHSKYSRATSKNMDLESLDKWAKIKGIKVLGTGDFTHPGWLANLKEKLKPAEPGLFKLKNNDQGARFFLTSEISCIYSKNGKVRKIHIIVFAPSFKAVEKINTKLNKIGNLKADGRPILGLDAKELAKIVLEADPDCMVIPAHVWTPWFSLFGSKSGFNSIEECFEEYSKYIYVMETGLSSDPAMNWRISFLDRITFISNSDCHSPQKIGREANVFDTELSYGAITEALKIKDSKKFLYTVEFYPEEGKYHFDGHRNCDVVLSPKETKKYGGLCPVCGKPLTVGVLNRVEELADRKEGFIPSNHIPFKSLVPLNEIISDVIGVGTASKAVGIEYDNLINKLGSEFEILLKTKESFLKEVTRPEIAEGIIKARDGKVTKTPGYDGVFGRISVSSIKEKKISINQKTLF
ncbi:MAG: endonuclease Q family protein [Candidatus Nealsonbacteria bacterium]